MSEWAPKRFWTDTSVDAVPGGFSVLLDKRPVRTPAKSAFVVPTRAMADAVAQEWEAQTDKVDPLTMPVTRSANAAIDKVRVQHREVADLIADYGGTDLLCYRAGGPESLSARQRAEWDPLLDWGAAEFGGALTVAAGVMHVAQPQPVLDRMRARVHGLGDFQLAAMHDLVSISGSLIIGFAAIQPDADLDALWRTSRLDELWQQEQWGRDEEAESMAETKRHGFLHAARFFALTE